DRQRQDPHRRGDHDPPGVDDRARQHGGRGGAADERAARRRDPRLRPEAPGRHPHRARPAAAGRGGGRCRDRDRRRLDDRRSDHDHAGCGPDHRVHQPGRATLSPPAGGGRGRARWHHLDPRPDQAGADPAGGQARYRGAARSEGGGRRGDGDRRRARAGGVLSLPPVQRDRAQRAAPAGGRLAPDVRGRTPLAGPAGRLPGGDAPAARHPGGPRAHPARDRPRRGALRAAPGVADGHLPPRRRRGLPAGARHRRRHAARPGAARLRAHPDPPRGALPAQPGAGAGGSAPRAPLRRQLPLHADRRGADRGARLGDRALPDLDDRPRLQRLHVHRAGDHLHRGGPRRGGGRRDRRDVRPAARRRPEPGAGDAGGDRHARPRRRLDPRRGGARRADHGLRPRRLQDRRPALAAAAPRGRAPRGAARRVRQAGRAAGGRHPGGAEAGAQALRQRRVLRRRRDGGGGAAARDVHPDLHLQSHDRLVRAHHGAGRRQPPDPPQRPLRRPAAPAARPRRRV
ncbi:MAG: Citrate synthase (si), partial [uncultured Thermomicrobiales bacterium]